MQIKEQIICIFILKLIIVVFYVGESNENFFLYCIFL